MTFQDIEPEIEQKEMESWQTISRIMAHEIMNSLTPFSSLTETGIMLLENEGKARDVSRFPSRPLITSIWPLRPSRTETRHLAEFIGSYRQLSRLPLPERKGGLARDLLEELNGTIRTYLQRKGSAAPCLPGPETL